MSLYPDHASLPAEELRRRLAVTRPIITEPCMYCGRNDVGPDRFGGWCAGCDERHVDGCEPSSRCSGCRTWVVS